MTLIASSSPTTLSLKTNNDDITNSDTQSQSSNDEVTTVANYSPAESLVQSLGYPGGNALPPQFGQVSIENSSDVHFGDKNFYQGPVTIRQIVYANGTPLVASESSNKSGGKENLGYQASEFGDNTNCDGSSICIDLKTSDQPNYDKNSAHAAERSKVEATDVSVPRKGLVWFQKVIKPKMLELGLFAVIAILFLVVMTIVLLLRHPSTTQSKSAVDTSEQDKIKSLGFDTEITATSQLKNKLRIISRIEWVAQPPINTTTPLVTPVQYVIIHHTATENCSSIAQCVLHVRLIQTFHIDSRGYFDIGYNFLVGGDGAAYEGRGWTIEGAHSLGYNSRSIGIAFIGTFINMKPPDIQILAAKRLIQKGVELGYIKEDYKLLGARQLAGTESPGAALFEDMQTWPQWAKEP